MYSAMCKLQQLPLSESFRPSPGHPYTLALLCELGQGVGFIKFVTTHNIESRLASIQPLAPLPIKHVAALRVRTIEEAKALQKQLEVMFNFRILENGWYQFNFEAEEDKELFRTGSKAAIKMTLRAPIQTYWDSISSSDLKEYRRKATNKKKLQKHRKKLADQFFSSRKFQAA